MSTFNGEAFIKEFQEFIDTLDIKSIFEVGCQSGELINALPDDIQKQGIDIEPKIDGVIQADIRDYKSRKKFDVVFSSGLLEHFSEDEAIEIIKKMATLSKQYILNYVPNSNCLAYKNNKANTDAEWKNEKDFTAEEFAELHKKAGLEILQAGIAAKEWAKRFGSEPSDGYLVYVLAKKPE